MARRRENVARLGLTAALLFGVAFPLVTAAASGMIDSPQGDDWSFTRAAFALRDTHHFLLVDWGEMNLVGHLVWSLPFQWLFGSSVATLHVASAAAALIALLATYGTLRELVSPAMAAIGTAMLAVYPAFALLTTSFMTDVTAFAGASVSIYLGVVALRHDGRARALLLGAALVAGFAAFTSREIAILAPVAVIAGHLHDARARGTSLGRVAWLLPALLGCALLFMGWATDIPGRQPAELHQTLRLSSLQVVRGFFTVALFVAPALVLVMRRERLRGRPGAVGGAIAVALGVYLVSRKSEPISDLEVPLGNYFTRSGALGDDTGLGQRAELFSDVVWHAINACAVLAGIVLGAALAHTAVRAWAHRRALDSRMVLVTGYGLLTVGAFAVRAAQHGVLVDRYLFPVLVVVAIVLLRGRAAQPVRGPRRVATAAVTVSLAAITALLVLNLNSLYSARLDAAKAAVAGGVPANAIDAGFEWTGMHGGDATPLPGRAWQPPNPWYAYLFPKSSNCIQVSSSPLSDPNLRARGTVRYQRLPWRADRIHVYWNTLACDPRAFRG